MSTTLQEVAAGLVSHLPESHPDRVKVEKTVDQYDDTSLAKFLNDKGALDREMQRKYGLTKPTTNESASEIPEEAPDYVGDVNTAKDFGLKTDGSEMADLEDVEVPDTVESYEDLSVAQLRKVIADRNSDRDEDSQIPMPTGNRKAPYVAALEQDDEND